MNITVSTSAEKWQGVAPPAFPEDLRLPCRLDELSSRARARVGALLDAGAIRYVLDAGGNPIVARAR